MSGFRRLQPAYRISGRPITGWRTDSVIPPTDPSFSNVTLLLNGNGVNNQTTVVDNSGSQLVPQIFGNAKISTAQSRYGTSSLAFDGTGDCVLYAYNAGVDLPGDFTIEGWIYANTTSTGYILNHGGGAFIAWASYLLVYSSSGVNFAASAANAGYDIGSETGSTGLIGAAAPGAWHHIAVTRSGNVYRGFVNGVQGYTQTIAMNPFSPNPRGLAVGANFSSSWGTGIPTTSFNGYMHLRITKGVARYTANFVPPAAPFPTA